VQRFSLLGGDAAAVQQARAQLGVRLAMGDASSMSSLVTRFHRQGLNHTAGFQALDSQFAT